MSAPYKIIQKTKCKTFFLNSYIKDNKLFLDIEKFNSNNVEEISYLNNLNKYIENKIKLNLMNTFGNIEGLNQLLGKYINEPH